MSEDAAEPNAVGALLRRYRERRRLSQERCALVCEMDHSLVSRIENGQRGATRESLAKLATGLELSLPERDQLFVVAGLLPQGLAGDERGAPLAIAVWRALSRPDLGEREREAVEAIINAALVLVSDEE